MPLDDGHLNHVYGLAATRWHPAGEHALDRIPVDQSYDCGGVAHRAVRKAIDVAQRAGGVLMHQRDRASAAKMLLSPP